MAQYRRLTTIATPDAFRAYAAEVGDDLPLDDKIVVGAEAPLARPYRLSDGFVIGNRFCVHPMEGWDGTSDGKPTKLTFRRWRNFGRYWIPTIPICSGLRVGTQPCWPDSRDPTSPI